MGNEIRKIANVVVGTLFMMIIVDAILSHHNSPKIPVLSTISQLPRSIVLAIVAVAQAAGHLKYLERRTVRQAQRIDQMRWEALQIAKQSWDANKCTVCGYDLRGSPGPRCSECGTEMPPRDD